MLQVVFHTSITLRSTSTSADSQRDPDPRIHISRFTHRSRSTDPDAPDPLHDDCPNGQVYKVETAGDCYIVAGALMRKDEDGFLSIDNGTGDGGKGAEKVMAFAKVGRGLGNGHG